MPRKKLIASLILLFSIANLFNCNGKIIDEEISNVTSIKKDYKNPPSKYGYDVSREKIAELKEFLKAKNYNQNVAFFIDFKIPSGKYRFFVYDLKNDEVLAKGLVAHGSGSVVAGKNDLQFSNKENSLQSSLGKYEIANSYTGDFGKSYRLKGLDKTNNLAMIRAIVLHPYSCINDHESENLSCLSWGCPMLSQNFFNKVARYIDASKKPIVMYCYY